MADAIEELPSSTTKGKNRLYPWDAPRFQVPVPEGMTPYRLQNAVCAAIRSRLRRIPGPGWKTSFSAERNAVIVERKA